MQKIGILSGTFDPVHAGHVEFALAAIRQAKLDRVYFMVERRPRRKQGVKAFIHRQAMVQLAIADEPLLGSIITDEEQFTAETTLPLLKKRFGSARLFLLMGDDMLAHLNEWPHVDDLLKSVCLLIGVRHDTEKATSRLKAIESTRSLHFEYRLFESPHRTVSSSILRKKLRAGIKPHSLHPAVHRYIQAENLYASDVSGSMN